MANIFDFIPQNSSAIISNSKELDKIFSIFSKLIHSAIDSISAFFSKLYAAFDGHVGDTSCQVRACFIAYLEKRNKNKKLRNEQNYLIGVLRLLSDYKQQIKLHCINWKFKTLFEIVNSFINIIDIDSDTIFLAKLFFLSRYKVTGSDGNDYINIDMMCKQISLSRKAVKKIIHAYQNAITYESYRFIKELAHYIDNQSNEFLNPECYDVMLKVGDDNRVYLPAYATMITLVGFMINAKVPLVLQTCNRNFEPIFLIYQVNSQNLYERSNLFTTVANSSACIVISGSISGVHTQVEAIKKLNAINVVDMLLLNMSSHPQYTGVSLQQFKDEPYEEIINSNILNSKPDGLRTSLKKLQKNFVKSKNRAIKEGYCKENQSGFFINHIYCNNKNNFLDNEKSSEISTLINNLVSGEIKEEFYV